MNTSEALTTVYLTNHGLFAAYTSHVAAKLAQSTKTKMVNDIMDLWGGDSPESSVFQRAELKSFPAYVLAVILTQK